MTILELLADETPRHGGQPRGATQLIRRDMAEIEEARQKGYSWTQISKAAKRKWAMNGEWDEKKYVNFGLLYSKLKKEKAS